MSNNNNLSGYSKIIYTYGVPSAIAIFLVIFLTFGLNDSLDQIHEEHLDQRQLLYAICLNVSQTEVEIARCNHPR